MSSAVLHHALLRPAILQILRAAGFHSAAPSVVDTLTDFAGKYIALLASRTVSRAVENHNGTVPTITDVRLAMVDCGLLSPTSTSTEEVWRELLRKPLESIPERNGLRAMEIARRDEEDTAEIREFIAWFQGPVYKEMLRIAGMQRQEESGPGDGQSPAEVEDYLTTWKKKHSKTGEESRFQGTVLGIGLEPRPIKIEGGPESIKEWVHLRKQQASQSPARSPGSHIAIDSKRDSPQVIHHLPQSPGSNFTIGADTVMTG